MLLGRRLFEFGVPAAHIVFGETGAAHDRDPLFFRYHFVSP
jgi:hypothetical protein